MLHSVHIAVRMAQQHGSTTTSQRRAAWEQHPPRRQHNIYHGSNAAARRQRDIAQRHSEKVCRLALFPQCEHSSSVVHSGKLDARWRCRLHHRGWCRCVNPALPKAAFRRCPCAVRTGRYRERRIRHTKVALCTKMKCLLHGMHNSGGKHNTMRFPVFGGTAPKKRAVCITTEPVLGSFAFPRSVARNALRLRERCPVWLLARKSPLSSSRLPHAFCVDKVSTLLQQSALNVSESK